jgi:RNA polymerase sigma-70 factor, ECF subfamily
LTGSLSPLTDQDLTTASLRGDRRAFSELVCRYWDGVINVVYRMCGNSDLAEEAAQEAFIKAWQNLSSYKPEYSFRSWIYRIAVNKALDVLRREPVTVEIESPAIKNSLHSQHIGPEEALEKHERIEQVRRAVLALPEVGRAVLILREYQQLSYQEISTSLNIPVGTVMSRLNYARGQLRKQLLADGV